MFFPYIVLLVPLSEGLRYYCIMFMVAIQSRALMQKLHSFVNIMTRNKSVAVWHEVCTDMKVISLIPQPPAESALSSRAGSCVGRFALVCK